MHDYTALVGANGAGKSNVLCALNIFFRETENSSTNLNELDAEDFHAGNIDEPVEVTVVFHELNAEAQKEFAEYYRNGELVISVTATFDEQLRSANVKQFGQRMVMDDFKSFFRLYNDGAKAADLAKEYETLRTKYNELPKSTSKDGNRDALRLHEEANPDKCVLVASEDQFYGFSKGANRLAKFVQWIYVPAVKDATKENVEAKSTSLGKLLARTVRSKVKFDVEIKALREQTLEQYRKILGAQQGALDDISAGLSKRLQQWAHPDVTARLAWAEDPRKSVQVEEPLAHLIAGENSFEGNLARFGHGLQRSYLLALLQELAASEDADAPRLILGCEEPELYQHPPQARHLASVFQILSSGNAQILVSTHSPYFVTGEQFESVRMVRRNAAMNRSEISWITFDDIAKRLAAVTGEKIEPRLAQQARLHQALQPNLNEMFFTSRIVKTKKGHFGLIDTLQLVTPSHHMSQKVPSLLKFILEALDQRASPVKSSALAFT